MGNFRHKITMFILVHHIQTILKMGLMNIIPTSAIFQIYY